MPDKEIAVYTAIFGNYDDLKEPLHFQVKEEADFFCFTNSLQLHSKTYQVVNKDPGYGNPRKNARYFKTAGDPLLEDYKYVVWCDGAIQIIAKSLYDLIATIENYDIGILKHPDRNCAYQESKVCMIRGLDNPSEIYRQMKGYHDEGFPKDFGLLESSAFIRRTSKKTNLFFNLWWQEVHTKSIRDQLAFDYLRWKLKPNVYYFDGSFKTNLFFRSRGHKGKKNKSVPNDLLNKMADRTMKFYRALRIKYYVNKIDQLVS